MYTTHKQLYAWTARQVDVFRPRNSKWDNTDGPFVPKCMIYLSHDCTFNYVCPDNAKDNYVPDVASWTYPFSSAEESLFGMP